MRVVNTEGVRDRCCVPRRIPRLQGTEAEFLNASQGSGPILSEPIDLQQGGAYSVVLPWIGERQIMPAGGSADVELQETGAVGVLTLNRERALNALTHDMVRDISTALDRWQASTVIRHVVLRGRGRAFCAGGDLMDIYRQGKAGHPHFGFFQDEYRLNARLGVFPKPIIALIDGIVMGGGVGIAVHGQHRVMSENAVFSMPEASIGFFPDVGGSHFLSRLPNRMGFFLGLTGARIRAADAYRAGIATHIVAARHLDDLSVALAESEEAGEVLDQYHSADAAGTCQLDQEEIARLFAADTLHGVIERLGQESASSETAASALASMRRNSPTSLAVAFRQITEGRTKTLAQCMSMEYRILVRMLHGSDFYEGIRAVIIDKSNDPAWRPASLEAIESRTIDSYFDPLGSDELTDVPDRP